MPVLPSPSIPTSPSAQVAVTLKWAQALSSADLESLSECLTDDYIHQVLPASLGMAAVHGKEAIIKGYKSLLPHFTSTNITVHEVTEAPGKVIIYASTEITTDINYLYKNEYILTFKVTEQSDGTFKVAQLEEFTDSIATAAFREALTKAKGSA